MHIRKYILSVYLILVSSAAIAGDASSTGLPFLKVGVDAASSGMGGAAVSNTTGAASLYWNPAGLAVGKKSDVLFSHQEWLAGSSNQYLGISFPRTGTSFGLSISLSGIGDIERRDERPTAEPLGLFSANSIALALSVARGKSNGIKVGVTAKLLYEKISLYTASGFALDIGVIKPLKFHDLKAAVVLKDLGGMSSLNNESSSLPSRVTAGISGTLNPDSDNRFILALDAGKYFEASSFVRIGGEFELKQILSLRAGYRRNSENSTGLTAGIGITRDRYKFDYAYLPFDFNLGDTHQISFGIGL